jgi:predicted ATP-grasp superfamily ATP-dependent carboligase
MVRVPTAVIIGDHTQGLGIVRSAAEAGAEVWVVNDKCISLARFSRYLTGYKQVQRGTLSQLMWTKCAAGLREALLDIPFAGSAALFGVNEDITRFIHRNRAALQTRYFIPEVEFETIYDKFSFNALLPEAARIETHLCSEIDLGAQERPERYVLKGRSGNAFRQITGQKAIPLSQFSSSDRQRLFAQLAPDQVVLQAIVETARPVHSVCSFAVNGRVMGLFGYEKLRQHPNRFGTGTYLRSTSVDSLKPVTEHIIKRLNYTGISEIEFICDPSEDTYRVIEMNPRPWKSIHFATQCGGNLVGRHLLHMAGGLTAPDDHYLKGRYWADLATDIPQMFRERKLCRYHRGFFECVWDHYDPLPALILWTLFPLIGLENLLQPRGLRGRSETAVQHAR